MSISFAALKLILTLALCIFSGGWFYERWKDNKKVGFAIGLVTLVGSLFLLDSLYDVLVSDITKRVDADRQMSAPVEPNTASTLGRKEHEEAADWPKIIPSPADQVNSIVAKPGEHFSDCDECPAMVMLPPGEFMMGDPDYFGQDTRRMVAISAPFALGKYEVTFDEWDACVAAGGCDRQPDDEGWGRADRPVINVSWDQAKDYTYWLRRVTGEDYRLPSEAEWEYAARAGTTTAYPWGDEIGKNKANCQEKYCGDGFESTAPVGSFLANPFGLHDMHGNVWEWTEDTWHKDYESAPRDGSPQTDGDSRQRVNRGGAFFTGSHMITSAARTGGLPTSARFPGHGFRVARTVQP